MVVTLPAAVHAQQPAHKWSIVVHGGAGVIERSQLTAEGDAAYRASLTQAIEVGAKVLDQDGTALDAVEASIRILEDDPLFNAGRGAVFTSEGTNKLDSSIMDGSNLKAGAVAGITHTRHPISLARALMEKSPYVMMIGPGAENFGAMVGLEQVDPSSFSLKPAGSRWSSNYKKKAAPFRRVRPARRLRAQPCRLRCWMSRPMCIASAPWEWLRSTARGTSQRELRLADCRPRRRDAWATRRSSARGLTPPISPAPSPPPARVNTLSAWAWPAKYATWSPSRG